MGKQISPLTLWNNGSFISVDMFNMYIINDDLSSSCTFYYKLYQSSNIDAVVLDGNLTMSGIHYTNWTGSSDQAYQWGANQLNITIL